MYRVAQKHFLHIVYLTKIVCMTVKVNNSVIAYRTESIRHFKICLKNDVGTLIVIYISTFPGQLANFHFS